MNTATLPARSATTCIAFRGHQCIATGTLPEVASQVKKVIGSDANAPVIIFNDNTSAVIEVDFRGSMDDVLRRLAQSADTVVTTDVDSSANAAEGSTTDATEPRGRGRPRLGVVAREVTLLPRHWDWLNSQPGGASVALRKLVEEARRANSQQDQVRQAQNAAYRFMSSMASGQAEFEEAMRAFFAGDGLKFSELISGWPVDVREHIQKLSANIF